MAKLIAFADVLIFAGGVAVGVLFKDAILKVRDVAVSAYNWIKAKF